MNKHYFWAVKIPDEIKRQIEKNFNEVKVYFPFQRWVHHLDYHITLAFLGHAEQEQLQICNELVEANCHNFNSIKLHVVGLNFFGSSTMPSVFWAALSYEEKLMELQQMVYEQCIKTDFILDKRKFSPHITLARKWIGQELFQINDLTLYNPFIKPISFEANEVALYAVNTNCLPKYEAITTFQLTT